MKHAALVQSYPGTLEDLAEEIGNLRYDALDDFLKLLAAKISTDGDKDLQRGRKKLAARLHRAAENLRQGSAAIGEAWTICEPYMK